MSLFQRWTRSTGLQSLTFICSLMCTTKYLPPRVNIAQSAHSLFPRTAYKSFYFRHIPQLTVPSHPSHQPRRPVIQLPSHTSISRLPLGNRKKPWWRVSSHPCWQLHNAIWLAVWKTLNTSIVFLIYCFYLLCFHQGDNKIGLSVWVNRVFTCSNLQHYITLE